ncbi:helix-turn-helix domain-containing protein [Roseitalea porphyridii]|uniref:XRE family transcriptional regulator n=1 Tax=Roseitalea porphyridii TaxID=1852022 RepID=A0A4P6V011_9HYPH|nr:helix-turn-helix transcriptional regulator [Roseitalea porphyridii]QBK30143.1 XRE family transcriptional regulator [Roseitalea porphyridii]
MSDLKRRFGHLVAAHRRRSGMTQQRLAELVDVSVDTISKIETGASGARFALIERLAQALSVDPAELFTTEIPSGILRTKAYAELAARLARLDDNDLRWISDLIDVALRSKH